jgi:hypothetical protein
MVTIELGSIARDLNCREVWEAQKLGTTSVQLEGENFVESPCKRHHRSSLVFFPICLQAGVQKFKCSNPLTSSRTLFFAFRELTLQLQDPTLCRIFLEHSGLPQCVGTTGGQQKGSWGWSGSCQLTPEKRVIGFEVLC